MASENFVHRDMMIDELLPSFLRAAVEFHEAAWEIHQDHRLATDLAAAKCDFIDNGNHLIQVIHKMLAKESSSDDFIVACRKVGQDLNIKLQKLGDTLSGISGLTVDAANLCAAWPREDVQALGHRLHDMIQIWSAKHPDSVISVPSVTLIPLQTQAVIRNLNDPEQAQKGHSKAAKNQPEVDVFGYEDAKPQGSGSANKESKMKASLGNKLAPAGIISDFILESLAYKSMYDREEEITSAHKKTFEWVFHSLKNSTQDDQELKHHLTTWLSTDDLGPIYWITGKPGSGKSTFVRYLYTHDRVASHLQKWAGQKSVLKAGFFFWTSGSREQRSQTGLLRSLLHQLLSVYPEHMPSTFPRLWQDLRSMTTKDRIKLQVEWTIEQLMESFESFLDAALLTEKVCLFVDGLDEFDGDHAKMIDFFKGLVNRDGGHNVKLCLSSRPWSVFEAAFEFAVPNLKLQDLTRNDMYQYARDRLNSAPISRRQMRESHDAAENLLSQIVQQADGVFLWVKLAVNQLLDTVVPMASAQSSSISQLEVILATLPTEIEDLFSKLLFEDQNNLQISVTASMLQLVRAREVVADFIRDESSNSLTVWDLAFAMKSTDDDLAVYGEVDQASDSVIQERCEDVQHTVKQRFAGLLDLFPPRAREQRIDSSQPSAFAHYRLTYIHRTVRDWVMEAEGVRGRLLEHLPEEFDANLQLLRSYVMRLKISLEYPEKHRRLDEWWPDIALAMTHARYIKKDPQENQRKFLNELNATLSWYWQRKSRDPYDHWARNAFGAYEVRMKAPPIWQPFLCLATRFGLVNYVLEEVQEGNRRWTNGEVSDLEQELVDSDATPLLSYATEFLCSTQKTIFPLSNPLLVAGLLENCGPINPGPNHEYADFTTRAKRTPWIAVLRHLRDARRRGWIEYYDTSPQGTKRWTDIVRLFVETGGADVEAIIVADAWDPEITALGVIQLLEQTYQSSEFAYLEQLFLRTRAEKC